MICSYRHMYVYAMENIEDSTTV